MTKRIAALLAVLLLLAGCGAADDWRVKVRSRNDSIINLVVNSPVVNLQETTGKDDRGYFLLTEEEFVRQFNELAAADGLPEITPNQILGDYGTKGIKVLLSITIKKGTQYISNIEFYLSPDSEETARLVGEYFYNILDIFTEDRAKEISDTLHAFGEAPAGIPNKRLLVCGNTVYEYKEDVFNSLPTKVGIRAAVDPDWEQQEPSSAPEIILPIQPEN